MAFLFPWARARTAYDIEYRTLYKEGVRGLLFDIDYTLVPYDAPATTEAKALIDDLRKMGFVCRFVSNNHEDRCALFDEEIQTGYVTDAMKPLPFGFRKAIRSMRLPKSRVVSIGDQLFTDVLGGNLAGTRTILVGRVDKAREFQLILKSVFESFLLWIYEHTGMRRDITA